MMAQNKRKREETEETPEVFVREPFDISPTLYLTGKVDFDSSISQAKLFSSGDLLAIGQHHVITVYKDCIFQSVANLAYIESPGIQMGNITHIKSQVDAYRDSRGLRHYVAATNQGEIIFALTGEDDRVSIIDYQLNLDDPDSEIL